jgi:hypothetical protein
MHKIDYQIFKMFQIIERVYEMIDSLLKRRISSQTFL